MLGILAGGSFQAITGQLMQLLAAIIGHRRSPHAPGICTQVSPHSVNGAGVLPEVPICFASAPFDLWQNGKALNDFVFLKRAPTAALKVERTRHAAACNCRRSGG